MSLFQLGDFRLNSGLRSDYKIDCDALTDNDWECLALLLKKRIPDFGAVEGVPRGGLKLAIQMRRFATCGPLLIVDDVSTTGGSMERHRDGRSAIGGVIFARAKVPEWVVPLFSVLQGEN